MKTLCHLQQMTTTEDNQKYCVVGILKIVLEELCTQAQLVRSKMHVSRQYSGFEVYTCHTTPYIMV